jgi:chromosome segregation ATPase
MSEWICPYCGEDYQQNCDMNFRHAVEDCRLRLQRQRDDAQGALRTALRNHKRAMEERDNLQRRLEDEFRTTERLQRERDAALEDGKRRLLRVTDVIQQRNEAQATIERHNQRCIELLEEKLKLIEDLRKCMHDRDEWKQKAERHWKSLNLRDEPEADDLQKIRELQGQLDAESSIQWTLRKQVEELQEQVGILQSNECVALMERDKARRQGDLAVQAMEQFRVQRDEAQQTAERAHAMICKLPKDWDYEDADLLLNDVPWKRSKLCRQMSERVLQTLREKHGRNGASG